MTYLAAGLGLFVGWLFRDMQAHRPPSDWFDVFDDDETL